MDINGCLNSILTNKGYHMENENRVFKFCGDEWIAVMEKCEDTVTNESRSNVADSRYAKFRANKLKVIEIFNKFDCSKTIDKVKHETALRSGMTYTRYKVGEDAVPDSFDNDLDSVCSNGIHYFKTLEPAFYFGLLCVKSVFLNGTHKYWHGNGNLGCEVNYKDNKRHGPYKTYYENGNIECEGNYEDDGCDGLWTYWQDNKKPLCKENYKNGKRHGPYKEWYKNGNISCEGNYENDSRDGLWKYWYDNKNLSREKNYKNGKHHGPYKTWYKNGNISCEGNYEDGNRDGPWKYWDDNKKLSCEIEWHKDQNIACKRNYEDGNLRMDYGNIEKERIY